MKKKLVCAALLIIAVAGMPTASMAKSVSVDEDILLALQDMIKKQQAQLDSQAKAIAAMQEKLVGQDNKIANIPAAVEIEEKGGVYLIPGTDRVSVKLSGQVNKAVMFADDGHQDEVLFVDNDNSSTRIRLKGNIKVDEEWSAGSDFEVEYQTNDSNAVSMDNQSFDSGFKRRKLDFHLLSKTYGKLSLGHGQSASDDTAEADLSDTAVIGYSSVSSNGGGFKFYDNAVGSYSGVTVSSAYSNLDGLSRIDRVRYDTPRLSGFMLSTSFGEDNASDLALRYNNKFEQFTVDARVGWAYLKADTQDEDQVSASASILFNKGFNLTVAAGNRSRLTVGKDDATFYYGKVGQKFNLCAWGSTDVSLDYGKYGDQAANNDEGDVYGVQFVQNITRLSSELYLGYRLFSLDSDGTDYDDISSLMSGFRFRF